MRENDREISKNKEKVVGLRSHISNIQVDIGKLRLQKT